MELQHIMSVWIMYFQVASAALFDVGAPRARSGVVFGPVKFTSGGSQSLSPEGLYALSEQFNQSRCSQFAFERRDMEICQGVTHTVNSRKTNARTLHHDNGSYNWKAPCKTCSLYKWIKKVPKQPKCKHFKLMGHERNLYIMQKLVYLWLLINQIKIAILEALNINCLIK